MNLVSSHNNWTFVQLLCELTRFMRAKFHDNDRGCRDNNYLMISKYFTKNCDYFCHFSDLGIWNDTNTLQCEHICSLLLTKKTYKMWSTHPYKISSNPSRLSQNWPAWAFRPLKSTKFENPFWKIARSPYSRNGFTDHCQTWQGDAYCHLDRADRQNFEIYKSTMVAVAILTKKIEKTASLTDIHHPTLLILSNKTANIIKTKLESVSLSCKSHRSKTANIKFLSANSKHRS